MSSIAVVAGRRDAQFAEQVRAGLHAAGRQALIQEQLRADSPAHVVLIWSAGLESAHAIDAKTLIGLWSEDRLTVIRRDDTPLPLGLRDLPSLGSEASAEEVARSALRSREAEPSERASRSRVARLAGWLFAIALVAGGVWYYFNKANLEKQAALTAALETAARESEALKAAQAQQQAALKKLEEARAAELAAIKAGDQAKIKEAQEAARRAETEAAKQTEVVKQRAAVAADARKKTQEAAENAKKTSAVQKEQKSEVATATPKSEPAPAKVAPLATKAEPAAPKGATVTPKAEAPKKAGPLSRSERERLADEEAARKALAKAGQAPIKEQTAVASAVPSRAAEGGAAVAAKASVEHEVLYQQALEMEIGGDAKGAIRLYRRAARAGSGKAAKRLGEIYDRGLPGVSRDYAESLQWYETARQLGESIETASRRDGGGIADAPAREPIPEVKIPAPVPASEPAAPSVVAEAPKVQAPRGTRERSAESSKIAPAPKPAPAPAVAADRAPDAAKAAEPAPAAPAPAPAAAAAPASAAPSTPEPEPRRTSWRFALIGALVLALVLWRRTRKRRARAAEAAAPRAAAPAPAPVSPAPAPAADGATLFVSYSHKDRQRVDPIVSVIEEMGRRVWMDRTGITGQAGWAGQIVRAIRECRAVVLMASPNSYSSDQVVRELYLAMNHKKAIVPIEIEPAEMPDELQYILAPFQHHRLSGGEARTVLGRALAAI